MCIMCFEIARGRMTIQEGRQALKELIVTTVDQEQLTHYRELNDLSDDELYQKTKESTVPEDKQQP